MRREEKFNGYIARDADNALFMYRARPFLDDTWKCYEVDFEEDDKVLTGSTNALPAASHRLNDNLFSSVAYGDEPLRVQVIIAES